MSAIAMRIKGKKGLSAVQRGLAVLRKYGTNAHLWLPGVGYFNGQQLGNFLDSGGTTAASVDNPIGLVLDQLYGGGTLGANLATVQAATLSGSSGYVCVSANSAVSGQYYKVSYTYNLTSGAIQTSIGSGVGSAIVGPASGVFTGVYAASASGQISIYSNAAVGSISGFVVQQVLGIPASQATTANKPTLRRGITNLLTYSNDLTNSSAWTKVTATASADSVTFTAAASAQVSQNVPALPGSPVTAVAKVSVSSGTKSFRLKFWDGTVDRFTPDLTATTTPKLVVLNGTGTSFGACNIAVVNGTDAAVGTVIVDGVGFFVGTLTAAQILACGGIPLTTSAPASSSQGNWGWQGNGSSTFLPLASPPGITNACAIVAGVSTNSATTTQAIYGEGINGPQLYFNASGGLVFDKGGVTTLVSKASVASPGIPMVVSARLLAGTADLRKNGTQLSSATSALTFSGTTAQLIASASSSFFNGIVYAEALLPLSVPDADLLAIERMAAAFTGPTGVTF